jgi:Tfp pilus tip-associated adhesin PilY1
MGDWRTILFMPLGPKSEGLYALDVTDPVKSDPPFEVIWYWNGKNTSITTKEIWSPVPVGLSQLDGKVGASYRKWFTAFTSTHESDVNQNNFFSIVRADTGQTLVTKTLAPVSNALVPFHAYGNVAFMETDQPIYMPDALVTHAITADTAGRIPTLKLNNDNVNAWNWNNPANPLDFTKSQPVYYAPSVSHGVSTNAMLLATAAGSIYESSEAMNGATTNYITRVFLDLLDIDKNTKDVKQNDINKQHKQWDLSGTFQVDEDGDGTPDSTKTFSTLTRVTTRPLISIVGGTTGSALYMVFDPLDYNPAYGVCTGKTYIYPVNFTLQELSSGGASAGFASVQTKPLWGVGYGVITGIASGTEKIVVGVTAYGEEGVAVPEFTPYDDPNPPSVLPRLRSVKRLQ